MFSPIVQLRSGGYIVINQTEALVAIDVNSGRATREHHIEDTALKTNLEAAEEIARQLRLRDLAGLIVIDFIDMDEKRNNRAVERRLKECAASNDRARIQVGRISHFGLLEMSRQRIRTGVLESSTETCPHCGGTGHVRSVSSVALQLLRALEEMLLKGATHNLIVRTRTEIALYLLNHKRAHLRALEERFRITITVNADATHRRAAVVRHRSRRAGAQRSNRRRRWRAAGDRGRRSRRRTRRSRRRGRGRASVRSRRTRRRTSRKPWPKPDGEQGHDRERQRPQAPAPRGAAAAAAKAARHSSRSATAHSRSEPAASSPPPRSSTSLGRRGRSARGRRTAEPLPSRAARRTATASAGDAGAVGAADGAIGATARASGVAARAPAVEPELARADAPISTAQPAPASDPAEHR